LLETLIVFITESNSVSLVPVVMMNTESSSLSQVVMPDEQASVDTMQYYNNNDKKLPIFSNTYVGYLAEKIARILLNPDLSQVCYIQPMSATKNTSFIMDLDDVEFADLKANDLGTWKAKGTKTTHFWIHLSGSIMTRIFKN